MLEIVGIAMMASRKAALTMLRPVGRSKAERHGDERGEQCYYHGPDDQRPDPVFRGIVGRIPGGAEEELRHGDLFEQGDPFPEEEQHDHPQQQHRQECEKGKDILDDGLSGMSRGCFLPDSHYGQILIVADQGELHEARPWQGSQVKV